MLIYKIRVLSYFLVQFGTLKKNVPMFFWYFYTDVRITCI